MHIKTLKIWNFRCIGQGNNGEPGLTIDFNPSINLLIGANDSGKTAIIDAIKYCLGTQTYDPVRIDEEDFYQNPDNKERSHEFKIEIIFGGLSDIEGGQFLEYINFNEKNEAELTVKFTATNKDNRITTNLKSGIDEEGQYLEGSVRDLLRVTYLKPLRDAEVELSPGYRSRLYQILKSHNIFIKKENKKHIFEKYFEYANKLVLDFFEKEELEDNQELSIEKGEVGGKKIKEMFTSQTREFLEERDKRTPQIKITSAELQSILRKLELALEENKAGLGTLNLLYMAAELIHLKRENYYGLRLALIEELEAHLHPQAQLRVLKTLINKEKSGVQYILTTHSVILGSSIPLEYVKICYNGAVYSLDKNSTALDESDYKFLERFLDATKANIFFAKGIIIVEGYAENIIIPTVAEIIERPLHKYGVSIVNIGSKAFLRYVNIFKQKNGSTLPIKVAVVTDLDVDIDEGRDIEENQDVNNSEERKNIEKKYSSNDGNIKVFVSPYKTLEYDIALGNLYEYMYKAVEIAKKCNRNNWVNEGELKNILNNKYDLNVNEKKEKAKYIYQSLKKGKASKTTVAQWFAKLMIENKSHFLELIEKDCKENNGISHIVNAIKHVTE